MGKILSTIIAFILSINTKTVVYKQKNIDEVEQHRVVLDNNIQESVVIDKSVAIKN